MEIDNLHRIFVYYGFLLSLAYLFDLPIASPEPKPVEEHNMKTTRLAGKRLFFKKGIVIILCISCKITEFIPYISMEKSKINHFSDYSSTFHKVSITVPSTHLTIPTTSLVKCGFVGLPQISSASSFNV